MPRVVFTLKNEHSQDERVSLEFFDARTFRDKVEIHIVKKDTSLWRLAIGKDLTSSLCDLVENTDGEDSRAVSQAYDKFLNRLEDGIEFSVKQPLYLLYQQKETRKGENSSRTHTTYSFLAREGYQVRVKEGYVETFFFKVKTSADSLYTLFNEAYREAQRYFRAKQKDAKEGTQRHDSKSNRDYIWLTVVMVSEENWTDFANPHTPPSQRAPGTGGPAMLTPRRVAFHTRSLKDYSECWKSLERRQLMKMSTGEAAYHVLEHAGMLVRYTGDENHLRFLTELSAPERRALILAACDYVAEMVLPTRVEQLVKCEALDEEGLEQLEYLYVQRDGLGTVLNLARGLAQDQFGDDAELGDAFEESRRVAVQASDLLLSRDDFLPVAGEVLADLPRKIRVPEGAAGRWSLDEPMQSAELHQRAHLQAAFAVPASVKGSHWIGQFLRWLSMRLKDLAASRPSLSGQFEGMYAMPTQRQHRVVLAESPDQALGGEVTVQVREPTDGPRDLVLKVQLDTKDPRLAGRLPAHFRAVLLMPEVQKRLLEAAGRLSTDSGPVLLTQDALDSLPAKILSAALSVEGAIGQDGYGASSPRVLPDEQEDEDADPSRAVAIVCIERK